MNRNELAKYVKPDTAMMLETLSRQAGRDAVEVAEELHPDFAETSPEWKASVFESLHNFMRAKGDPITPENARHAAQFLISDLECDVARQQEENPKTPAPFTPKSAEWEADFFNDPATSAEAIKHYLQAKHAHR